MPHGAAFAKYRQREKVLPRQTQGLSRQPVAGFFAVYKAPIPVNQMQFDRLAVLVPQPQRRDRSFQYLRNYRKDMSKNLVHIRLGRQKIEGLLQRLVGARQLSSTVCRGEVTLFEDRYPARAFPEV